MNEARQNRQDVQQYADKIYLGEPPTSVYAHDRHPVALRGQIWRVVINASGVQAENVWVTDGDGLSINIRGLQRRSMYAFPVGFKVEHLYFTDPNGNWHRRFGGQVERVPDDRYIAPPAEDTGGNSAWDEPIENCAG